MSLQAQTPSTAEAPDQAASPSSGVMVASAEDNAQFQWIEKHLEGNYWAAVVAEGDIGRSSLTISDTQTNLCQYCAEGGSGKPLQNLSYLENPMRRQKEVVVEDEPSQLVSTQSATGKEEKACKNSTVAKIKTRLKTK